MNVFTKENKPDIFKIGETVPEDGYTLERGATLDEVLSKDIMDENDKTKLTNDQLFNKVNNKEQKNKAFERFLKEKGSGITLDPEADWTGWKINEDDLIDPKDKTRVFGLSTFKDPIEISAAADGNLKWKFAGSDGRFNNLERGVGTLNQAVDRVALRNEMMRMMQDRAAARGTGNGAGSGGGGGGGGDPSQMLQSALQIAQQIAGFLTGLKPTSNQGNIDMYPFGNADAIAVAFSDGAEGVFTGQDGSPELLIAQSGEASAILREGDEDREVVLEHAAGVVDSQVAFMVEEPTEFSLNGIKDDAASPATESGTSPNLVNVISLPFLKSVFSFLSPLVIPSITAQVVTGEAVQGGLSSEGQYVKLLEHDMDMSGRDIVIDTLKTFNKVQVGGQNLNVYSGDIQIQFNGQKTYYPRLVKKAPYGIAEVSNKLDKKNKFKLQHYTNRKSQFKDEDERVSSSDVVMKHPKKKLIISKMREDMWKSS